MVAASLPDALERFRELTSVMYYQISLSREKMVTHAQRHKSTTKQLDLSCDIQYCFQKENGPFCSSNLRKMGALFPDTLERS